jgi:hypothetical protein
MVLTPRFIAKSVAAKVATAPARPAATTAPRTQQARVLHSSRTPAQLSFCFTRV